MPANCTFGVDNVGEDWVWQPFDFIHFRNLGQGIRLYIYQIYRGRPPGSAVQLPMLDMLVGSGRVRAGGFERAVSRDCST